MSNPRYQVFLLCPFALCGPRDSPKRQNISITTPAPSRSVGYIPKAGPILIEFDCDGLDTGHFMFRDVNWDLMSRYLTDLLTAAIGLEFVHIGTVKSGSPSQILKLLPFPEPRAPVVGLRPRRASAFSDSYDAIYAISEAMFDPNFHAHPHSREIVDASSFYRAALENLTTSPSLSYSLLVSSLECLSLTVEPQEEELYDRDMLELFDRIRRSEEFGETVYRQLKGRLRQLKRRVELCVLHYIQEDYKEKSKRFELIPTLRDTLPDISKGVRAAYDLRSKHLHSGFDHAPWTDLSSVAFYRPPHPPSVVQKAPNLSDLECLVQHCLSWALQRIILGLKAGNITNNS